MNIIFLGPPGAGKGTVAAALKEKLVIDHLSTGDILRGEIKAGSELGLMAKRYIDEGGLVPDSVIIDMVKKRLESAKGSVLFDGFPRTVDQAKALDAIAVIDAVINLEADIETVVARMCSRRICSDCGAVYNTHWHKSDSCAKCGGSLYIRDDDNEDTAKKRYEVYMAQTAPLISYYDAKGLVHTFDANDSTATIAQQIISVLELAK